jgi:hypothetical protein
MHRVTWSLVCIICEIAIQAFVPCCAALAEEPHPDDDAYQKAIVDFFSKRHAVAVLIPADQQVGDVYDLDPEPSLLYRSKDCFPTLKLSDPQSAAIPESLSVTKAAANAGISSWFGGASLDANFEQLAFLKYDEAKIVRVSPKELLDKLDAIRCPELVPLLQTRFAKTDQPLRHLLIVNGVFIAKPTVTIGLVANSAVDVVVKQLQSSVVGQPIGLTVTAAAGMQRGITLTSNVPVPVAVTPAVIFQKRISVGLGDDTSASQITGYQWMVYDPETYPNQESLLEKFFPGAVGVRKRK